MYKTIIFIIHLLVLINTKLSGLDNYVVVGLEVLVGKKEASCPKGYIFASGCNSSSLGCDINDDTMGDYIYICQKKVKFKDLTVNDIPITKIALIFSSDNCGNLNIIKKDLNLGNAGHKIYICYGKDETDNIPISDIFTYIPEDNNLPAGYTCIDKNTNDDTLFGKESYICYKKEKNVPKSVKYINLNLKYEQQIIKKLEIPNIYGIIRNDNGNSDRENTVTKEIETSTEKSYSWNFEYENHVEEELNENLKIDKLIDVEETIRVTADFSKGKTNAYYNKTSSKSKYVCKASPKQYIKCSIISYKYQVDIPYYIEAVYTYFNESTYTQKIKSVFTDISTSEAQLKSCCIKGCENKKEICDNDDNPYSEECPVKTIDLSKKEINNINLNNFDKEKEVVINLAVVNGGKETTCPPDHVVINSGCDKEGCDLNDEAGGDYVYLCQKKKKLKDLKIGEKPINAFDFTNTNTGCGNLELIDKDLNVDAGGDYIYLCFGNDPNINLPPIIDFFIYIVKVNNPPSGYECDSRDLNNKAGGYDIFLCYKRDSSIPKKINIRDVKFNFDEMERRNIAFPKFIKYISVTNGDISTEDIVENYYKEERNMHVSSNTTTFLGLNLSGSVDVALIHFGINLSESYKTTQEWKNLIEIKDSEEIKCFSEEGKTMKCAAYSINYQAIVPYIMSIDYIDYTDNIVSQSTYSGIFELNSVSEIYYKSCCQDGCCTGDEENDKKYPHCANNTKIDILCEEIMECFQNKESVNGDKSDDDENDDDVEIIRKLHSENIINNKNMIYIFIIAFISILL